MAISDQIPERRNLVVLSLFIIIFYASGAQFIDQVIRLQVINVTFEKPEVLTYFVWGGLFWFCYRYWLTQQGSWKENYRQELNSGCCKFIYYNYLVKKFGLSKDYSKSLTEGEHHVYIDADSNQIYFKHVYCKTGQRQLGSDQEREVAEVNSIKDKWYIFLCTVYLYIRKPTLSNYFTPYLLFFIAFGLLVIKA